MQINFYMTDQDRTEFHRFLFSRGAYFTPQVSRTPRPPLSSESTTIDLEDVNCSIFLEEVHSSQWLLPPNFDRSPWLTPWRDRGFWVQGPSLEYTRSTVIEGGIIRGRIYTGTTGVLGEYRGTDILLLDGRITNREESKQVILRMEKLYKSLAAHIRRRYRRDGFCYHGPDSDRLQREGVRKFQFIGTNGPVPENGFMNASNEP
jgi:hypothetical protein